MTAPRPVEPVVGMEYDGLPLGVFERCRIVAMTSRTVTYRTLGEDALTLTVTRADFMQSWKRCRPVLWTVGTSAEFGGALVRLGRYLTQRGPWVWAPLPKDVLGDHPFMRICAWPTRAAALAAGRAFGWERPVARRVVRKVER